MKISGSPSLQELYGQITNNHCNQEITIISKSNYLKNIRDELLEVESTSENNQNNEIIFTTADLQGVSAEIMIDTGANVSLIEKVESVSYTHLDVYKRQV